MNTRRVFMHSVTAERTYREIELHVTSHGRRLYFLSAAEMRQKYRACFPTRNWKMSLSVNDREVCMFWS